MVADCQQEIADAIQQSDFQMAMTAGLVVVVVSLIYGAALLWEVWGRGFR